MEDRIITCKSCGYFDYLPGEADGNGPLGGMGECHRYAPRALTPPPGHSAGDSHQTVIWPQVPDTAWCGEFKRRQETW